jgi:chromosome segregation ATPase
LFCQIDQYERRLQAVQEELKVAQGERRKYLDEVPTLKSLLYVLLNAYFAVSLSQIGALQTKLRESQSSSHDHHDLLKSELARRDETIQALRHDILRLQEKRDAYQSEVRSSCKSFFSCTKHILWWQFYSHSLSNNFFPVYKHAARLASAGRS